MGNFMKGVSDGKLLEAEGRLLNRSGLSMDQVHIDSVIIDAQGNCIRTIQVGKPAKEDVRVYMPFMYYYNAGIPTEVRIVTWLWAVGRNFLQTNERLHGGRHPPHPY